MSAPKITPQEYRSMLPDTEGLHEIANTSSPDRVADIVFVHGLGGSSHATWRHGKEDGDDHFFWPEELGKELPGCGVWSVGYAADITRASGSGMLIGLRAMSVASLLTNARLGLDRPLIFITHSMGGLVIKALIDGCRENTDDDAETLVRNIWGIAFCGTPHRGTTFATAAAVLAKVIGGTTGWVDEMKQGTDGIELLHGRFLGWHRHSQVRLVALAETSVSFGFRYGFRIEVGRVVDPASARLATEPFHQHLNANHLQLVKPPNFTDVTYGKIRSFIDDCLALQRQ